MKSSVTVVCQSRLVTGNLLSSTLAFVDRLSDKIDSSGAKSGRRLRAYALPAILSLLAATPVLAQGRSPESAAQKRESAIGRTRLIVQQIVKDSYPELKSADVRITTFTDDADYFRTGFDLARFLSGRKMRYIIKVNPRVFALQAPEEGVRAILAHELGHVFDFHRKKRVCLLGLVRLSTRSYTARFERWTDLQAISRGYAAGLKAYRQWLLQNVPANKLAEKRRNYFSPAEIDALTAQRQQQPEALQYWLKHVPRNLQEISQRK